MYRYAMIAVAGLGLSACTVETQPDVALAPAPVVVEQPMVYGTPAYVERVVVPGTGTVVHSERIETRIR